MINQVKENLDFNLMNSLLRSVFDLKEGERALTILVDLPDEKIRDNENWRERRCIAAEWFKILRENIMNLPFTSIRICTYVNVGTNNNDLPPTVQLVKDNSDMSAWISGEEIELNSILESSSVILAPTELSATAPLKNLAKQFGFRGATLLGFNRAMIPALQLDYEQVHNRVMQLKFRLDRATTASIIFLTDGHRYSLKLDLRHRSAHASGGLIRDNGVVGNLPSGEAYIVPYEGEIIGDASQTSGSLPVQFGREIVVYRVENNRAVGVLTSGNASKQEHAKLQEEPAYGNIAELGFGVLGEWGVTAVGSILLDEKLGLHIAFGRSEHFGGITGPSAFHNPANVIHIDRVFVPSSQPLIEVEEAVLSYEGGETEKIMERGKYVV